MEREGLEHLVGQRSPDLRAVQLTKLAHFHLSVKSGRTWYVKSHNGERRSRAPCGSKVTRLVSRTAHKIITDKIYGYIAAIRVKDNPSSAQSLRFQLIEDMDSPVFRPRFRLCRAMSFSIIMTPACNFVYQALPLFSMQH